MRIVEYDDLTTLDLKFYGVIKHMYKRNTLPSINPLTTIQKPTGKLTVVFKDDYVIAFSLTENGNIKHLAVDTQLSKKEKAEAFKLLYEKTKK